MDKMDAWMAASIVRAAAAKQTDTICKETNVTLSNKGDAFWLEIVIGLCPYNTGLPLAMWQQQVGGQRETLYAHFMRIRIPETALEQEPETRDKHRLKAIGESLADIWYESRYFNHIRQDRHYIIPYVSATPVDVRLVKFPSTRGG